MVVQDFHTIQSILKLDEEKTMIRTVEYFHTIQSILKLNHSPYIKPSIYTFPYYSVHFKAIVNYDCVWYIG